MEILNLGTLEGLSYSATAIYTYLLMRQPKDGLLLEYICWRELVVAGIPDSEDAREPGHLITHTRAIHWIQFVDDELLELLGWDCPNIAAEPP